MWSAKLRGKNAVLGQLFIQKNHPVTKTGSGQTQENVKKSGVFCLSGWDPVLLAPVQHGLSEQRLDQVQRGWGQELVAVAAG